MIYLPDTNVWSVWMRGGNDKLHDRLQAESRAGHLYLCAIVAAELRFGAVWKSHGVRNMALLDRVLDSYTILPFDESCVDAYARLRAPLAATGRQIGLNDMLIAAIAMTHGLTVVTHNTNEFGRIANLNFEDWES